MAIRRNADGSITVGILPPSKAKNEPTPQVEKMKAAPVAETTEEKVSVSAPEPLKKSTKKSK